MYLSSLTVYHIFCCKSSCLKLAFVLFTAEVTIYPQNANLGVLQHKIERCFSICAPLSGFNVTSLPPTRRFTVRLTPAPQPVVFSIWTSSPRSSPDNGYIVARHLLLGTLRDGMLRRFSKYVMLVFSDIFTLSELTSETHTLGHTPGFPQC